MQSKIAHAAERKAFSVALDQIIKAASGDDREKNLDKLINMAGNLLKDTAPGATRGLKAGLYPGSKWEQFLWSVIDETDPHVLKTVVLNGGYEAAFRGLRNTTANADKYQCNVPWIIIFPPARATSTALAAGLLTTRSGRTSRTRSATRLSRRAPSLAATST